jgi:hypothetical protein
MVYGGAILIPRPPHGELKGLPSGVFPSGLPTKISYAFLISPMHATCPACIVVLDVITLVKFGEA